MSKVAKASPAKQVVPLKVNAFEQMRLASTALAPIFPYMHAGAIIPCTASFENVPGSFMGYFIHENSVDEVALVLGSNSRNRSGDVWRGPRRHGVGFDAPVPFFMTMVITQRQREDGDQPETVIFQCEKCNEDLVVGHFSGAEDEHYAFPPLPTTEGTLKFAQDQLPEEARTCKSCGHVSREFPISVWGWERYMRNTRVVEQGHAALKEAVA